MPDRALGASTLESDYDFASIPAASWMIGLRRKVSSSTSEVRSEGASQCRRPVIHIVE
jgi:hypothetical protein